MADKKITIVVPETQRAKIAEAAKCLGAKIADFVAHTAVRCAEEVVKQKDLAKKEK